jgi:carbonic anhydrase
MQIVDNGHTIQVQGTENSYITVEGKKYQFKQFHFHYPAEHTLDNKTYPMEMHLVHQEGGTNNLVVLGIFIEQRRMICWKKYLSKFRRKRKKKLQQM